MLVVVVYGPQFESGKAEHGGEMRQLQAWLQGGSRGRFAYSVTRGAPPVKPAVARPSAVLPHSGCQLEAAVLALCLSTVGKACLGGQQTSSFAG